MFILISSQYEIFDSKNGLSDWLKFGNIMLESAFGIAKTKHTHTAIHRDFDGLATGSSYFLIIHLFIFISLTLSLSLWFELVLFYCRRWNFDGMHKNGRARARAHAHTEQTISTNIYGEKNMWK